MIYISRRQDTTIITDNVVEYTPKTLDIYLDDTLIGTYLNTSTSELYIRFLIPTADVINYQQREYKLKIVSYSALLKEELVIMVDNTKEPITEYTKEKQIKFYEGY